MNSSLLLKPVHSRHCMVYLHGRSLSLACSAEEILRCSGDCVFPDKTGQGISCTARRSPINQADVSVNARRCNMCGCTWVASLVAARCNVSG